MKKLVSQLLVLMLAALLTACGGNADNTTNTTTPIPSLDLPSVSGEATDPSLAVEDGTDPATESESAQPVPSLTRSTESPVATVVPVSEQRIDTPYCTLRVPVEFDGTVTASVGSENPFRLDFLAKDGSRLFSILFGSETQNLLGTLSLPEENIVLYADFAEFDKSSPNYVTYLHLQNGINVVIEHLIEDYDFTVNEVLKKERDAGVFDIKTPIVTLKYPSKWQNVVTVDVSSDRAAFSCKGTALFDLVFTECDGYLLGTYGKAPIYIIDYSISSSLANYDDLCAMQQDVNVILNYLSQDPSFRANG